MVSFIVFIIGIFIVVLGVFLSLAASLIQFILNLIIANILPISLILFGSFTLLVISAIFLPEPEQSKEEDDFQHSTAQAYTRENTVSDREESKKTTINVKSTIVREEAKSDKSYKKKKTDRASTKHNTKEKPSSSTENKYCNKNSFQTQTSVLYERNVETENHCEIKREQIYYSGSSEVEPELRRLKLFQSKTTIKSGETIQFQVAGLDRFDNQIEISDCISWSATAGEIDSTGLFSFDSIDDVLVTVTAKVSEIEATAKVNIENIYELLAPPKLKYLKVIPDCICLKPEEEQVFTALGFDRHDNPIDCGEVIWLATGGMIDQDGKLIVSNNAKGIYQVTATSKNTAKHSAVVKTTLLTLGVSTRILSWAIANEEFFYDVLAPLLNLTNDDDSLSETDALVQEWIIEIGRRRIAKLIKKASNLSFKEAFSNLSDSIDYIVLPELRKIEFVNPPSKVKQGDRIQFNTIGFDQAGDKLNVQDEIIWTATSGLIDSQGIFIADSNANSVEITAKVKDKNLKAKTKLKIKTNSREITEEVNKSNGLEIYSPRYLIQAGQTKKFQIITGFDSRGNPIEYKGEKAIWNTTAGEINSEGLLNTPVTNGDRYIEVSAKIGELELIYSFHTTGLHEYTFSTKFKHVSDLLDTAPNVFDIVEDINSSLDELSSLLRKMPELEQEIEAIEVAMKAK